MSHHMNEHENKRAVDRRLALLALASEQPASPGPCPEAETLAALVEGRLAQAESVGCRAHMADCEACYGLWLRLDQEWQQHQPASRKIGLLRLIRRPRVLTTVGSLLAAASVVLMLNLPVTQVDRISPPQVRKTTTEPVMPAPPAAAFAPPQAKPVPAELQDQPFPAPEHLTRPVEQAKADRQEIRVQDANTARKAVPPPAMIREWERKEIKEKAVAEPTDVGQAVEEERGEGRRREAAALLQPQQERMSVVAEEWYGHIRQGCQGEPQANFFSAIAAEGYRLLREPATLPDQDRQRIERIVAELGKKQPAGERCSALLEILEPKNQPAR